MTSWVLGTPNIRSRVTYVKSSKWALNSDGPLTDVLGANLMVVTPLHECSDPTLARRFRAEILVVQTQAARAKTLTTLVTKSKMSYLLPRRGYDTAEASPPLDTVVTSLEPLETMFSPLELWVMFC